VGEYFAFPFEFAVSILKSLVKFDFVHEVKEGSQLFLPLVTEKTKLVPINMGNGMTISEMAKELKLPIKTVEGRIQRAGIKPMTKEALYSPDTIELIRNIKMGRPKKTEEPDK
jgi:hypothetical protein